MPEESEKTKIARKEIIKMYEDKGFQVSEEEVFPCKYNVEGKDGEQILFYQADIVVTKKFIIELDPLFHQSRKHINKDDWRDKNIFREYTVKTARVNPSHVLDTNLIHTILPDIEYQLQDKKYNDIIVEKRSRKRNVIT